MRPGSDMVGTISRRRLGVAGLALLVVVLAQGVALPAAKSGLEDNNTAKEKKETLRLAPGERVNINTASKEDLEKIPGIGPVKAQAIIKHRPYKTPEDIMKVKGIKDKTYQKIKDYITVK